MNDLLENYKVFRGYIEHEDLLINNRLLWIIQIQGFLFATYGYSIQKLSDETAKGRVEIRVLILLLPLVGCILGFLAGKGVKAAQYAIDNLCHQWNQVLIKHYPEEQIHPKLPKLIGGGFPERHGLAPSRQIHNWGLLAPKYMPRIFVVAWIVLFLASVYQSLNGCEFL